MKLIAVTQRVDINTSYGERRDALDQRWSELLLQAGLLPVPVPNQPEWVASYLQSQAFDGLLLTGGNSLPSCGGDAPERDATETLLLDQALKQNLPVLGVCRGMQLLLDRAGAMLQPVSGHVAPCQEIEIDGERGTVNSYHDWGTSDAGDDYRVWARADDGVIKAIRQRQLPWWGIMWHPERITPFRDDDIALLRRIFDRHEEL